MDDWWINRPQPWHLKCYRLTHTHCTWDWRSDFEKKYLTSLRAKCCWFSASHSGDFHQTRYVKALHHVEWLLWSPKKTQCYIKPHSGHAKKYKTHLLPTQERQERAVAVSSRISSPHWFVLKLKWRLREGIVVVNKAPVISLEGLFLTYLDVISDNPPEDVVGGWHLFFFPYLQNTWLLPGIHIIQYLSHPKIVCAILLSSMIS